MSDFSVAALARKWCGATRHGKGARLCICSELESAIHEALEMAEKMVRGHEGVRGDVVAYIAAAIRALRGKG